MNDKKYEITYLDKNWGGTKQIFTLHLFAYSQEEAREMAEELIFPATILSIEKQD
jgi:hypothetical protein